MAVKQTMDLPRALELISYMIAVVLVISGAISTVTIRDVAIARWLFIMTIVFILVGITFRWV